MATRTISNAGGNFNATGTWVEGVVPVAGDAVVATATSGQLTINVASGGVGLLSFILTGYISTVTWNSTLTVAGNVTLAGTMAGTAGTLIINAAATLVSNAVVLTCKLTLSGINTKSLTDAWFVDGLVTVGGAVGTQTINGSTLNCNTSLTAGTATTHIVTGTALFQFSGSVDGTWISTATFKCDLTINKSGGTLSSSGIINYNTGTLTYTAGTVNMGTSLVLCILATTLDTDRGGGNHIAFYEIGFLGTTTLTTDLYTTTLRLVGTGTFAGAGKVNGNWSVTNLRILPTTTTVWTMTNNWSCVNLILTPATFQLTLSGAFSLTITGDITGVGSGVLLGAAGLIYAGTGTWNATNVIRNNFNINTAGTLTLGADVTYNTGTLTYTAGTVDAMTNNSRLDIAANTTLNTDGMSWNIIDFSPLLAGSTITLTSNLSAVTMNIWHYTAIFAGAGVWTVDNFNMSIAFAASHILQLSIGNEYTVNVSITIISLADYPILIKSSVGGTKAKLTYNGTSNNQRLIEVDATDIDSSDGNKLWTLGGTLSGSLNWDVSNARVAPKNYVHVY